MQLGADDFYAKYGPTIAPAWWQSEAGQDKVYTYYAKARRKGNDDLAATSPSVLPLVRNIRGAMYACTMQMLDAEEKSAGGNLWAHLEYRFGAGVEQTISSVLPDLRQSPAGAPGDAESVAAQLHRLDPIDKGGVDTTNLRNLANAVPQTVFTKVVDFEVNYQSQYGLP